MNARKINARKDMIDEQEARSKAVEELKQASIMMEEIVFTLDTLNTAFSDFSDLIAEAVNLANEYNGIISEDSISEPISLDKVTEFSGDIENTIATLSEEIVSSIGKIDKEIEKLRNS